MTFADPRSFLEAQLHARLSPESFHWLQQVCAGVIGSGAGAHFYLAFSSMPRRLGKRDLALDAAQRAEALRIREGWQPGSWSLDQAGRSCLLLALAVREQGAGYRAAVESLFEDADLGEQVALYQSLPLLPEPQAWRARAAEGVRSNMQAVFEAVARRNPYPAEQLEAEPFDQLVLKCLFVGTPLRDVWGLDTRLTPRLAQMLCDYARERWAAGRTVPWELWRAVGPLAEGDLLEPLARVLEQGSLQERLAAALSMRHNPRAAQLLRDHRALCAQLDARRLDWEELATLEEV